MATKLKTHRWETRMIGSHKRQYLQTPNYHAREGQRTPLVIWSTTPWFVSVNRHSIPELRYQVSGTGMDSSGSAETFSCHRLMNQAKAAVLTLAALDAVEVDRFVVGDVTFLIGDRVAFIRTDGFCRPRRGVIETINSAGLALIRWSNEREPSLQRLCMFKPDPVVSRKPVLETV